MDHVQVHVGPVNGPHTRLSSLASVPTGRYPRKTVKMDIYKYIFWTLFTLSFGVYFIQHIICAYFFKTQNLKRRYNAQWALVTGASSGLHLSLCQGRSAICRSQGASSPGRC